MGPALVDGLEGGELEKERLKAILETLSGRCTIEEACSSVGLARSRFLELRDRVLSGGLEALEPGVPGRPPKRAEVDSQEHEELRRLAGWLREELEISRVRTEIALVCPEHLTEPVSQPPRVRGKARARVRRKQKRSGVRSGGTARS